MYLPLWLRLFGTFGTGDVNVHVVHAPGVVSALPEPAPQTVVMKFGGSSVADPDKIRPSRGGWSRRTRPGRAWSGRCPRWATRPTRCSSSPAASRPSPIRRELDMLLSTGERIACALVAMAVHDLGHEAVSFTGSQAGIITDPVHTKAKIREITPVRIVAALDEHKIVLVAGFQGFSRDTMDITTLGRGGTDATAVALASALDATCEIYSDVPGVFTADPRIVPEARKLDVVSYEEMLEMAASGAKVLMLRAVEIARARGVPIHARSTFSDEPGTRVQEVAGMEEAIVSAVTQSDDEVVFVLSGVPDRPGSAAADLRRDRRRARERGHDPAERRARHGRAVPLRPRGRRAGHAPGARARTGADRAGPRRRDRRPRQGLARRSGHALASGCRRAHVPDARGRESEHPHDLDLTDQDLVHGQPGRASSAPCGHCTRRSSSSGRQARRD